MSLIYLDFGNSPTAESGYQNIRWQVDDSNPFDQKVSGEVPQATDTVAGVLQITGDIGGTFFSPKVVGLQGTGIDTTAPTSGQFLKIIGGVWKPHTLLAADVTDLATALAGTYQLLSAKDNPGGYCGLDGSGLVPVSNLPSLVIDHTYVVVSQAAMLALSANVGDVAVRTDINETFILQATPASTLGNWIQILTPPGVTSVGISMPTEFSVSSSPITTTGTLSITWASESANVVLASPNGSAGTPSFRALVEADVTGLVSDLGLKAPLASPALTGTPTTPTATALSDNTTIANTKYVDDAVSTAVGGLSSTLAGDTDVSITSPSAGQLLVYDSGAAKWKNHTLVAGDIPNLAESQITGLVSDLSTLSSAISTLTSAISAETTRAEAAEALAELLSHKDAASGYAGLDASTYLKTAEFPAFTGDISKPAGGVATTVVALRGTALLNVSPSDGQALTFNATDGGWEPENLASTGGAVPVSSTMSKTTGTLAANAYETGIWTTGTVAKGFTIFKMVVNKAARVRLYSTAAQRDADTGRPNTIPVTPGTQHGLLLDLYLDTNDKLTWLLSPAVLCFNLDSPQVKQVYYTITNLGTTSQAVTATASFAATES